MVMIERSALLHAAHAATGLDDLGPPAWSEGLDQLLASANREAALSEVGEAVLTAQIRQSLTNRLEVVSWLGAHPEVTTAPIETPVFVLGLPRTGTTLLSYVLDQDPANRSLMRWECFRSTPPPEREQFTTDSRIAEAQQEMDALYAALPGFRAIHYETGDGPTECVTVLGQDFRSVHFETMANLPSYGAWLSQADMEPAYRWLRSVLQLLQWHAPGRWVLKSPCHNLALDSLDAVFPDARFVIPHRDPLIAVASLASLVSALSGLGTDHDFDTYIGRRWLNLAALMIDRMLDFRRRVGEHRFIDIGYERLTADPFDSVAALYESLDWSMPESAEKRMRAYLADHPRGRFGRHEYALNRFGLAPDEVAERFAPYRRRFLPEAGGARP
jgi:hypothetical protein